ncbi:MAG: N-acetylmuramoyl-L-alanine amidase, partial [Ilumatobacteraceae bacterium]|nr:N-acetylmuramoyl-L-alanine amidase [Ilumatobacteraceae bacterium]
VVGQTVPNLVMSKVGGDGKVKIYNNSGASHVVVDVLGAFVDNAPGRFVALPPGRVLDTRVGTGAPTAPVDQTPLLLQLTGVAGVPSTSVSAVLMNVTVVSPTDSTFVTLYPSGTDRPLASNLNAVPGQVVPNMVLGRLGPDGAIAIYNNTGTVDLVADVVGYFTG